MSSSDSFVAHEFFHWVATGQLQAEVIFRHLDADIVLLIAKLLPFFMPFLADMLTWAKPDRFRAMNPQTPAKYRIPLSVGLQVTPKIFYEMMENAFFHKFEGSVFKGQTEKDNGYDGLLKFLVNNLALVGNKDDIKYYACESVKTACKRGTLEIAASTAEKFQLSPGSFRLSKAYAIVDDLSESGKFDLLRWFLERFNFSEEIMMSFYNVALKHASICGYGDIAQWVCEKSEHSEQFFRADNFLCFRYACMNDHVELAQWFAAKFGMIGTITGRTSEAFEYAVMNGSYTTVQWLCDFCQITKTQVQQCFAFLKRMVRNFEHVSVARMLIGKYEMTPDEYRPFMSDDLFQKLNRNRR